MRGTRLWMALALLLALATVFFAACGDDDDESAGSGDATTATEESGATGQDFQTAEEGVLTVGTDAPYPPFEIGSPGRSNFSGYDVEVIEAIADELGLEVKWVDTGFNTIFRDTANGQFDTAAAASDIDARREKVVDFTDPYYQSATALVVTEDSDIQSIEDLSGKIVGVQDGTSQQEYAEDETDAAEVRGFPEGPNAIAALNTGQVDAVLTDLATGSVAVQETEGIQIVQEIPTDVFFGFAVAPDNDGLREAMNGALRTLKENGTINELYEKYFGTSAPQEVLEGTNELLTDD
jgi:ABC-type amino acid transport/signal transduction systems, periplasmic component/domain